MSTVALREVLQGYIATADDEKILALHTVLEKELQAQAYACDDEEWALIEEARKSMREGKGSTKPWREVPAEIREEALARRAA